MIMLQEITKCLHERPEDVPTQDGRLLGPILTSGVLGPGRVMVSSTQGWRALGTTRKAARSSF